MNGDTSWAGWTNSWTPTPTWPTTTSGTCRTALKPSGSPSAEPTPAPPARLARMTHPPARVAVAAVLSNPLDAARLAAAVDNQHAGAVVTFTGVVRDHDHGRAVTGIEYVGHPSAQQIIADVAAELAGREGVHAIAVEHRVGTLAVG